MDLSLDNELEPAESTSAAAAVAPVRPLRVCVLVDLLWTPSAGGHVKFWERVAAGAAGRDDLDLTIYFGAAGKRHVDGEHRVAENVRFRLLHPVFSTERLGFLGHVPDHTDLAPYHRRLARELRRYDVIHTTDAYFAFARTALKVARRHGIPLVNSVHTDTPGYTRLYTAETVRRIFGRSWIARLLLDRLKVDARMARSKLAALLRHQAACAYVFGPRDQDLWDARRVLPARHVLRLPRGLELARFNPKWRDRAWLAQKFGIAADVPVVLCVGRVNVGKNVMILAEAVQRLAARGERLVLICAGEGEDRARIADLLGGHVRCPGVVAGYDMARLYASADILAHPSEIETFGNVVAEGMAAGLPAVVSALSGASHQVRDGVTGRVVGASDAAWAEALSTLLADPERCRAMGRAARAAAERRFPPWERIVADRFLPVWRRAAAVDAAASAAPPAAHPASAAEPAAEPAPR